MMLTRKKRQERPSFWPGQVWGYATRPHEPKATLTVLEVDGECVEILLREVRIRGRDGVVKSHHLLTVSMDALEQSVAGFRGWEFDSPAFQEFRESWHRSRGAHRARPMSQPVAKLLDILEQE